MGSQLCLQLRSDAILNETHYERTFMTNVAVPATAKSTLRGGQRLGKYRLERRIGMGGFASVYSATDTILGIKVAIKVPLSCHVSEELLSEFRKEVRLTMRMDHPNVLPIRDATFIDGHFAIVSPLGETTLDQRLRSRIGFDRALSILEQLVSGVSHAHQQGIVHCDIKPENVLIFKDGLVRLADFGIAKAAIKTISGSGTGTIGHMAPEQAMGKPSARSDVFSIGLIAYRMFSGHWPEYPFDWPIPGHEKLRRTCHRDFIALIRRSISVKPRQRYRNATHLAAELKRIRPRIVRYSKRNRG